MSFGITELFMLAGLYDLGTIPTGGLGYRSRGGAFFMAVSYTDRRRTVCILILFVFN